MNIRKNNILGLLKNENNKSIIINVMGAFIVKGGSMVVSLLILPGYLRYFQDETVLGVWLTILSVLNWVLSFDLGIGNGLRNKLTIAIANNNRKDIKLYISSAYVMIGMFSGAIIGIAFVIFPYINWNKIFAVSSEVISPYIMDMSVKIVFIGLMIQFLLRLINSIIYALQKSAINNALALLSNIVILVMVYALPHTNPEIDIIRLSYVNILAVNVPLFIATVAVFNKELSDCKPSAKQYKSDYAKEVLGMGVAFFALQFASILIGNTNEFLISHFCYSAAVVEYQPYYKLTNVCISMFGLAMTPIWSAVTKGMGKGDFAWIRKLYICLLYIALFAGIAMFLLIPVLPYIVNIWLGDTYIIKASYTFTFVIYAIFVLWNSVNSTIANGLGALKMQAIFLTLGAVINIPLAYLFSRIFNSWIAIVYANIISYVPICITQPVYLNKILKEKIKSANNNHSIQSEGQK